jgi:hypothetical protein
LLLKLKLKYILCFKVALLALFAAKSLIYILAKVLAIKRSFAILAFILSARFNTINAIDLVGFGRLVLRSGLLLNN